MSSEIATEKLTSTSPEAPRPDDIAAALDEARQNARLLRVSSSLFLREAKELIDAEKASVLVWASDFLEGSTEDAKERLQDLQQSTTSCGLPTVSVESKKLLAELVGLGKIGGRLRRQAICLLAVVLDPAGEDAPALTKLLEQLPQVPLKRKTSVPAPAPVTPGAKAAPSKSTVFRHHYTPDAPGFRAALSQKDSLPVLRRTGSRASSSRRSSDAGQTSRPESAQQERTPGPIHEGAKLSDSLAVPKASTPAPAAAASSEPAPASGAAMSALRSTPEAQPAAEPAKGAATKPKQGLQASEPVKALAHNSNSKAAVKPPATMSDQANGAASQSQGARAGSASSEPAPASGAAVSAFSSTTDVQPAAEPAKGAATEPKQGLQASEPVKALPHTRSSGPAVKPPATMSDQANVDAPQPQGAPHPAAAASSEPASTSEAAASALSSTSGAQPAVEPAKGTATKPTQGLQASEPVKAQLHNSSSKAAVKPPATKGNQANGDAPQSKGAAAAPPPSPAETMIKEPAQSEASQTAQEVARQDGKDNKGASAEQQSQLDEEPSAQATVSLSQSPGTPVKPATQKEAAEPYTPGAGMPEAPRRASAEAPEQEPAARAGSTARPEEVSAFRMARRRRSSSAARAHSEPENAPVAAAKAVEPAAPSSSPAHASENDKKPGHIDGESGAEGADQDGKLTPSSLQDMMVPPEMHDTEAVKAVWTGTSVEPTPPGHT